MEWFFDLVTNPYLLTALSAWAVAQVVKTILYAVMNGRIDWERLFGDGEIEADNCVTVRDRDTMEQVRIPIAELKDYIAKKCEF